jgi:hypothetical protein
LEFNQGYTTMHGQPIIKIPQICNNNWHFCRVCTRHGLSSSICQYALSSEHTALRGRTWYLSQKFISPPYPSVKSALVEACMELIPWARVLLKKLTGLQLVKKFPAFYGTWRFITTFRTARFPFLCWARAIRCMPLNHFLKIHFNIIPHSTSRSFKLCPLSDFINTLKNVSISKIMTHGLQMDCNNICDLCVFQRLPATISLDVMYLEPERYYLFVSNAEFKNV